jgi:hypothetical protein
MGWWLGLAPATLEFWVRFPNERNQGKQAHPVLKYRVPHGSQPRPGWAPDPLMVGIRSPDGLVVGLAPATLEFWVRFPNERNQGKQAHPVLKYRVPHGSHLGSSYLIAHVLHSPPPPRAQLCNRSCSNKHTQYTGMCYERRRPRVVTHTQASGRRLS